MTDEKIINKFSWKVAGEAGHGILNAGLQMFAKSCLRGGLHVFATAEYPSLIRGGHNNLDVQVGGSEVFSHSKYVNLLVALDKNAIDKHKAKITPNGGVIYDSNSIKVEPSYVGRDDIFVYPVPLLQLAEQGGSKIIRNTVAIGATFALLDFDLELLYDILRANFGAKKGEAVVNANINAANLGYEYIKKNFAVDDFPFKLQRLDKKERVFLSGNESITIGAIKAGCKFYAAYPMTPASSILSNMASQERNFNIVVKHTEDEIAAINMAIGASFAGARTAVGTSGGGFALMTEGLGLAAQTEVPIVVIEAQRPGPASGMATHSSQGDLRFMLHASTDEFPRIVIAPGDVEDCFYMTMDAFNLAEKYQMPVIILTDKYLGESYRSAPVFDQNKIKIERGLLLSDEEAEKQQDYRRYKITEDGISPRAIPGQKNCVHTASSYEHDEEGFEREEEEIRVAMHNKRFRKMEMAQKEIESRATQFFGNGYADVTIISWGSNKGPIREAMRLLEEDGISVNFLQVAYLSPFPTKKIEETVKLAKKVVVVECNKTSQLSSIIKEHTGIDVQNKILKYDGRAFAPEDIETGIKQILQKEVSVLEFSRYGIIKEV
jgi:2-oxoglutarate ferredoxin oxidoreductase subunit alpha